MATDSNSTDQASESLQKLTLDPQAKRSEAQNTDEETASHTALETSRQASETAVPVPTSVQPTAVVTPDAAFQPGMYYEQQSNFVPAYFYAGYENAVPEWGEEFPRYVNADGTEVPSHGFFGEKGPVIYHPGFAYAPQMAYGHYSATGMPVSNVRPDASLYGAQHFQYPGHFYQHTVPSAVQYVSAPTQMTQPELMPSVCTDPVPFSTDPHSLNYANPSNISTPNMGYYPISFGSFGPGVMPTNIVPCYDGVNASNSFAELTNVAENQQRPCSAPPMAAVISQPVPAIGGFGQSVHAPLHAIQQQRPLSGVAPSATPYSRVYSPNRTYPLSQSSGRLSPSFGTNGRAWVAIDKNRSKGRATTSCDFPGSMDILSEQNKGPRIRLRNQPSSSDTQGKEHESTSNEKVESDVVVNREQYNKPDFPTTYKSAKFFIIKSYSEDNIHKSIKYGVWASTPSGNKRLDAAYKAAQHKPDGCPVFLFFSVNASGQFCGVAEMLGPVDFEKSVDYWQQDKWSGQFPVRWHIIKDVSNSLFRHIILANNDSKPVTNSRDTQEVPLEKGIEMLEIFKNHSAGASILDDFHYYEVRQKMMQEKKAMQQNYYGFRGPVQEGDRFQATMHINHAIQEIRIPNVQEDYAGASSSRPTEESQTKEDGNGASSSVPTKNKSILLSDSNVKENSQA